MDSYDSDARMELNEFSIERFSTGVKSWIETLMEETKSVFFGKFESEKRGKSKQVAFLQILDDDKLNTRIKTNDS